MVAEFADGRSKKLSIEDRIAIQKQHDRRLRRAPANIARYCGARARRSDAQGLCAELRGSLAATVD